MQLVARNSTTQTVSYSSASVGAATPFGSQTRQIRVVANSACHIRIGDGAQTATTADPFLPANWIEYIAVTPGQQIAAIQAATNGLVTATAGTLWVTELTA